MMLCDQSGSFSSPAVPGRASHHSGHTNGLSDRNSRQQDIVAIASEGGTDCASLDPDESNPRSADSTYRSFRHSFWRLQRRRVTEALHAIRADPPEFVPKTSSSYAVRSRKPPWSDDTIDRFDRCGSRAWILRSLEETPRYRISTDRCRNRFCFACQKERGQLISLNLKTKLPTAELRFITLTIKAQPASLSEALAHLAESFTKLRRSKIWTTHVAGGLFVLEVTWNRKADTWHPHLHLITEGTFFPHDQLREAWRKATGDSFIVDIRRVRNVDEASHYLATYITKSLAKGVWHDPARLREAILTLHGKKLISTFGTWYKIKLLERPNDNTEWETIGPASRLLLHALRGEKDSQSLAACIWKRQYLDFVQERAP